MYPHKYPNLVNTSHAKGANAAHQILRPLLLFLSRFLRLSLLLFIQHLLPLLPLSLFLLVRQHLIVLGALLRVFEHAIYLDGVEQESRTELALGVLVCLSGFRAIFVSGGLE